MLSTAASTTFQKASAHALSYFSTSATPSPFSSISVDIHGFLKSSHRVGGPILCSLPALSTGRAPGINASLSSKLKDHTAHILKEFPLEFIFVTLIGRRSKVDREPEPIPTILIVMPDKLTLTSGILL